METPVQRRPGRPRDRALEGRRREEILRAAADLFAQSGYSATTTQALADRLQVGKGTIYRYFPTKEALFLAAVDQGMRDLRSAIDASLEGVDEPLERVACATRAYLDFYAQRPDLVELLIQERAQFKERRKLTYFERREVNVERWRVLFRGLIAQGRVRDMPVERIMDVMGDLLYGTMFTNFFTRRERSSAEQTADILDVVFHGILRNA